MIKSILKTSLELLKIAGAVAAAIGLGLIIFAIFFLSLVAIFALGMLALHFFANMLEFVIDLLEALT
jgi:hypothetical protein